MDAAVIQVNMLGGFSIRRGDAEVTVNARSKKLCLLLACLIRERKRTVLYSELLDLLWEGQDSDSTAFNALKAILHRARNFLDELVPGQGRALILSREGGCQWNPEAPVSVDTEEFCALARRAAQDARGQLSAGTAALALYRGRYLPMLAGSTWAAAEAGQLHQLYLSTALNILPLLAEAGRWQEVKDLSCAAFALEPHMEQLCRTYMEALYRLDRRQEAVRVYEEFQERLLAQKKMMPSDGLREFYRRVQRDSRPEALSPVLLLEQLQELPSQGALMCEYDFFRIVCHSMARLAGRSGEPIHIALISVVGEGDSPVAWNSLKRVMNNLRGIILSSLRRGDAAARCSASQYVLLLPQATYENSRMVCTRITRAFVRQYPHSPARLRVSVQPLPSAE